MKQSETTKCNMKEINLRERKFVDIETLGA